jgi:GNAT superfamily N-acetyltransferase
VLTVVPANEVSWADLQTVLGDRGEAARCQCQWSKNPGRTWYAMPVEQRAVDLRADTSCGDPDAPTTSGLVALLDGEPVGWCAVEPRTSYPRLRGHRVPWAGRSEDPDDPGVWAVTCFVTRTGFRRLGVSRALAAAAVEHARARGARALEGYPMVTEGGAEVTWGELFVGSRSVFTAAGFTEVSRPTTRRVVMRIEL